MFDGVRTFTPENAIDNAVAYSTEIVGKECIGCMRALPYVNFQRDSSYRDGRRDLCIECANSPKLSTAEHIARQREKNDRAAQFQRWENQEEYKNDEARIGRQLSDAELLLTLKREIPTLYITEGRIIGDWAVFQIYGQPQPALNGRDFRYLFYVPMGLMPEYSQYEFDSRDVPVREKKRGWRTVLLRLIKAGLITEDRCNTLFGPAMGQASSVWHRQLYKYRNKID